MSKKYEHIEDEPQMVSEPPVAAYAYATKEQDEDLAYWDSDDAPCRYTIDELKEIIRQGEEDIAHGRVHSHAEVQQMILNRIQAWR